MKKQLLIVALSLLISLSVIVFNQVIGVHEFDAGGLQETETSNVDYHFQQIDKEGLVASFEGWILAAGNDKLAEVNNILLLLEKNGQFVRVPAQIVQRDVDQSGNKLPYEQKNSGFQASVLKSLLSAGNYQVHLLLQLKNKQMLIKTNEKLSII